MYWSERWREERRRSAERGIGGGRRYQIRARRLTELEIQQRIEWTPIHDRPPVAPPQLMSPHPSPGPSLSASQSTNTPVPPSSRRPRPTHSIGIAAGAEDVKYQAKYKDL